MAFGMFAGCEKSTETSPDRLCEDFMQVVERRERWRPLESQEFELRDRKATCVERYRRFARQHPDEYATLTQCVNHSPAVEDWIRCGFGQDGS